MTRVSAKGCADDLTARLAPFAAKLEALEGRMLNRNQEVACGVDQQYWNPTLLQIKQWADEVAALRREVGAAGRAT